MKRVIVESPFRGENAYQQERNRRYALECMKDSIMRNEAPFLSHLLYTQILNEAIPEERELGINTGLLWGDVAEMTAVYTDNGITEGMQLGINHAIENGRPIEYRIIGDIKEKNIELHNAKLTSLVNQVSEHFGFHPEILKRGDRHRFIVDARHVYCAVARDLYPDISFREIGSIINRNHSTVMFALQKVRNVKEVRDVYNKFCETKKIQLCHSNH